MSLWIEKQGKEKMHFAAHAYHDFSFTPRHKLITVLFIRYADAFICHIKFLVSKMYVSIGDNVKNTEKNKGRK